MDPFFIGMIAGVLTGVLIWAIVFRRDISDWLKESVRYYTGGFYIWRELRREKRAVRR